MKTRRTRKEKPRENKRDEMKVKRKTKMNVSIIERLSEG